MNQKMLVSTFLNNNDYPDDISELPYGYETYIRCFPKFKRSDRYASWAKIMNNLFL